jgi:hypothetical protein
MAVAAVALIFYFRLTKLGGSSPYELFLLLNIVLAILVNPRALFAAVATFSVRFPVHHGDHITRSSRRVAAGA